MHVYFHWQVLIFLGYEGIILLNNPQHSPYFAKNHKRFNAYIFLVASAWEDTPEVEDMTEKEEAK